MSDLFSLAGHSPLVTGGSRGIGRMIATGFLNAGDRVDLASRIAAARDRGEEVARAVPAGRIGSDDDMAGAAVCLASRAGDWSAPYWSWTAASPLPAAEHSLALSCS